MSVTLINPMNELQVKSAPPPPRIKSLAGRKLALLDISKPGGSFFLDRLEKILRERYQVAEVLRARKPTYTKNAPDSVIEELRGVEAVIEGLAD